MYAMGGNLWQQKDCLLSTSTTEKYTQLETSPVLSGDFHGVAN
jgi:hypothetical protein